MTSLSGLNLAPLSRMFSFLQVYLIIQILFLPFLFCHQKALADLFIQAERFPVLKDGLGLDTSESKDVDGEVRQPSAFIPDHGQEFFPFLFGEAANRQSR